MLLMHLCSCVLRTAFCRQFAYKDRAPKENPCGTFGVRETIGRRRTREVEWLTIVDRS